MKAGPWGRQGREGEIALRQNKRDAESADNTTVEEAEGGAGFIVVQSGEGGAMPDRAG